MLKLKKSGGLLLGVLSLLLFLTACGAGTAGKGNFPTGKFVKPDDSTYGLIFREDGTFAVFAINNVTMVSGTYSVDGDIYTEESNDAGCSTPMKYKYTYDGTNLTFQYVGNPEDDSCLARRTDFNNRTYVLVTE